MFPVLFRIGSFEITSFGAMVALGAALGILLMRRELLRSGVDLAKGTDTALVGVLGGLAGAKLLYVFEHWAEPLSETLFSRGGMSWFGGLTGGVLAGLAMIAWQRLPLMTMLSAASPALALGHAIGRIGCFLVGDDYGRPTSLPWGVAFPQGLPPTTERVHPAQLYEAAILFPLAWLLVRMRRQGMPDRAVFGAYLVMAGAARFVIEIVRVNVRVALGLSTAQFFSIAAVVLGLAFVLTARSSEPRAQGAGGPSAHGSRLTAHGLPGAGPKARRGHKP
jgi:phosphatidylglycerol:prolipoprotein diacylglycerol transferase